MSAVANAAIAANDVDQANHGAAGAGSELAGRWRRLAATLIDAVLVPCLTLVLVMIAGVLEDAEDYADAMWVLWVFLLAVASYLLLNGYTLWRRGQTLGKWLTGIAIVRADVAGRASEDVRADAARVPLWKLVCIRALFFPLLFLVAVPWVTLLPLLDQLLIFRRNRRCLHDLLAGTIVVRRRAR